MLYRFEYLVKENLLNTNSLLQFMTILVSTQFRMYAFDAQVYRRLSFSGPTYQGLSEARTQFILVEVLFLLPFRFTPFFFLPESEASSKRYMITVDKMNVNKQTKQLVAL